MRATSVFLLLLAISWLGSSAEEQEEFLDSVDKRFVFYPGTKWCGAGDRASNYHDLGRHKQTDMCCRTHDHCKYSIPAFKRKWGLLNPSLITMSHCACEDTFRSCLKKANSGAARGVGNIYFNILRQKCFKFHNRRVCVKRGWLWKCKRYAKKVVAVRYKNRHF